MVSWNQLALILISHFLFLIADSIFRRPDLDKAKAKGLWTIGSMLTEEYPLADLVIFF